MPNYLGLKMPKQPGKKPSRGVPKKIKLGPGRAKKKKATRSVKIDRELFRRILNKEISGIEIIEMVRAKKLPADEAAFILMQVPGKPSTMELPGLLERVLSKKVSVQDIIKRADQKLISAEGAAFHVQ